MPIGEAWRRCPHAVFLPPRGRLYGEASRAIFEIFEHYTELVEGLSVDEAFLDVTASRRLFGDGPTIAQTIKERNSDETVADRVGRRRELEVRGQGGERSGKA